MSWMIAAAGPLERMGLDLGQALDVLDRLEHGVVLVDALARICQVNRAAQAILGAGIRVAAGVLVCEDAAETRALHRHIDAAATAGWLASSGSLAVRRCPGRRPLSVLVTRLRQSGRRQRADARALVIVNDPERTLAAGAVELADLYGLTPAEARAALALLEADGLAAVAEKLAIGRATVRTLLQRVFDKTETHSQAELVRLMMAHRLPRG